MKPSLVILAAGMGSRYGGLKQLDSVGPSGEVILDYSIYDALAAGFDKIIFVIRESFKKDFEEQIIRRYRGKVNYRFAFQRLNPEFKDIPVPKREKPWGTAHAVLVAKEHIQEPFAVINADDYYGKDGFTKMSEFLINNCTEKKQNMIGYRLGNTLSASGHVNRGICEVDEEDHLVDVVERLKIKKEGDKVFCQDESGKIELSENGVVSMNFWGFHPTFFHHLEKGFLDFVKKNYMEPKAEYYIPIIVDELIKSNSSVFKVLKSEDNWYGVTYQEDKAGVVKALFELHQAGRYPKKLW